MYEFRDFFSKTKWNLIQPQATLLDLIIYC